MKSGAIFFSDSESAPFTRDTLSKNDIFYLEILVRHPLICSIMDEDLFVLYREYPDGGKVLLMKDLDKSKSDYNDLLVIADQFAHLGHVVRVLKSVHYKDPLYREIFGDLVETRFYRKCPDLLVDTEFYEYEGYEKPWRKQKVQRMLTNGLRQSSRVIINNNKGVVDRHIRRLIMARVNLKASIDEVWVYEKGAIRLIYKNNREDDSSLQGNAP